MSVFADSVHDLDSANPALCSFTSSFETKITHYFCGLGLGDAAFG